MAERINSYCTVCGKGYHLCISCGSHKLTPWRAITDTSEHYKIHQILSAVTCGVYSEAEAKEKLMNVDLSDIGTYKKNVRDAINDIINADYKRSIVEKTIDNTATDTVRITNAVDTSVSVDANTVGTFETTISNEMSNDEMTKKNIKKKKSN